MRSQCVTKQTTDLNSCTYVRTVCTYRRIVVRTYVLISLLLDSIQTHWPKNICTYKISENSAQVFL